MAVFGFPLGFPLKTEQTTGNSKTSDPFEVGHEPAILSLTFAGSSKCCAAACWFSCREPQF